MKGSEYRLIEYMDGSKKRFKLLEKVNSSLKKKNMELSPATSKLEISISKII